MQITLAAARVNAGFTQKEAATRIGVDRSTVFNWEKGRTSPTYGQLKLLCGLYNMPIDNIFLPATLPKVEKSLYKQNVTDKINTA